ncbi:ATP-binding cassette domain-containing protein [Fibrobacterota bacterium]
MPAAGGKKVAGGFSKGAEVTQRDVIIKNARTHNLKGVSISIPKDKIVVFTGVSGSGKSSLVFDTIYTEAQRQLIETFSSFARARLPKLSKPPVDQIINISTAIIIDQKRLGTTLRSTVGTATEIYTYLRLLFSRCGKPFIGPSFLFGFNHPQGMCQDCKGLGKRVKVDIDRLINREKSIRQGAVDHPDYKVEGWYWREFMVMDLFDVEKSLRDFSKKELDDFLYTKGIPIEKKHGAGIYSKNFVGIARKLEQLYLNKPVEQLSNARKNAYEKYFVQEKCDTCGGTRLNEQARSVLVNGKTITDLAELELPDLSAFLTSIKGDVTRPLVEKIQQILSHLIETGVGYLSLNRSVASLSGGESQRVKMARQLDCDLVNMMYILDEPSIGLHPRDINRLIEMLGKLKRKGNSVFVVEHDPEVIKCSDYIIDIGPKAGSEGGNVVYAGDYQGLQSAGGLTAKFLSKPHVDGHRRKIWKDYFEIKDAAVHNLKQVSTRIPKGVLTCITGVAGSGKSSLINHVFAQEQKSAITVDQSPIGKSSRSNPATYIGIFNHIRQEFADAAGTSPSLFSFNSKGACPKCKGLGTIAYEMSFLDEVKVTCDECQGKRYTRDVLQLQYRGSNIDQVLHMTIREAGGFFTTSKITGKLQLLCDIGLDYLELGQPLSTLSGGESQRIKLASELHKKGNIYILDEPTTGLHMADIEKLIGIIKRLVENNNTVIVIEHNLDVIKKADWVIDLGPEGGNRGGEILFEGTPEDIVHCKKSYTGKYLAQA